MVCRQCGRSDEEGTRFCRGCGAPMPVGCPKCGSAEPTNAAFCGSCGARLDGASAPIRQQATPAPAPRQTAPPVRTDAAVARDERNATIVFADISRYTSLAASSEASDVFLFMADWYALVRDLAEKYGGLFSRAEGDCVMVVIGAPIACEDHPARACRLALDIRDTFRRFAREQGAAFGDSLEMSLHVGINSGPVAAGSLAAGAGESYDVLGHAVNEAKRLQTACPPGKIYAGQSTVARTQRDMLWGDPVELPVKGITGPVVARELVGIRRDGTSDTDDDIPFVGRARELSELWAIAGLARAGAGQLVTIMGEPGIGKSRLLHEFVVQLQGEGFGVFSARCLPNEQAIPYCATAQLVRGVLRLGAEDNAERVSQRAAELLGGGDASPGEDMARIGHVLGVGGASDSEPDPETRQRMVRRVLRRLMLAAAGDRPTAFAIEDVNWADPLSVDFLRHLAPWVASQPILILCTLRRGAELAWSGTPHARPIVLGGLSAQESETLAASALAQDDSSLAREIAQRAGGNPLFIVELARMAPAASADRVPATVRDVLMTRIDQLEPHRRRLVSWAAVLGARFRLAVLAAVTDQAPQRAMVEVEELVDAGWFRMASSGGDEAYEFAHILAQEVAYTRLSRRDRAAEHGRVAVAIEADPSLVPEDRSEVLAHHYLESNTKENAAPYLLAAMRRAESHEAHQSVRSYGEQFQDLVRQSPSAVIDRALELEACQLHAHACAVTGHNKEATQILARAKAVAETLGDTGALAMARLTEGATCLAMADFDGAIEGFQAAMSLWSATNDPNVAGAHNALGAVYMRQGDYESALAEFDRCANASADEVPAMLRAAATLNTGEVCTTLGRPDEALERFELAERLGAECSDIRLQACIQGGRAQALLAKGNAAQAVGCFEKAAELAGAAGDVGLRAEALIDVGQCHRRFGDYGKAIATALDGIELARDAEALNLVAMGQASLARTQWLAGETVGARSSATAALEQAEAIGDGIAAHLAQRVLADVAEHDGRLDDAVKLRQRAIALAVRTERRKDEAADLLDLGRSYMALHHLPEAIQALSRAVGIASEVGAKHLVAIASERLAYAYLASQDTESAAYTAGVACVAGEAVGSGELMCRAQLVAARAAEARGDAEAAVQAFEAMLASLPEAFPILDSTMSAVSASEALDAAEGFAERHTVPDTYRKAVAIVQSLSAGRAGAGRTEA